MAYTKKLVNRTDDASGDKFILQEAPSGSGEFAQGVVVIDETGAPSGITANPLKTSIIGTVTTSVTGTVTTSPAAGTSYTSGSLAVDTATISSTAVVLRELRAILNSSVTVDRYVQLFSVTPVPVDGATPVWTMLVPAGGEASESFQIGLNFSAACSIAFSTTLATLTKTTASEGFFFALTE